MTAYHTCTTGSTLAFAGLSDVKSTDSYASAINLCASLGIVGGFDDGTFQADGNVTREQFAKFAYVLMNGKDDDAALYKGVAPFGDVDSGRWSAGYIQWAKSRNIVAGRDVEQTVFDPSANVTFAEAAKMYVIALGYDAKNFTFPYGFIDKAQSLGLFADVKDYAVNTPANRGQVAQMTYNGLYAEAPYFGSYEASVGTGSSATTTKLYTPLEKAFEITEHPMQTVLHGTTSYAMDTTFTKNDQIYLSAVSGSIGATSYAAVSSAFDYAGEIDDLVGSAVRVFYKDIKGTSTGFDSGDLIVDIQEGKSNKQYSFKPGDVKTSGSTTTSNEKLYVAIDGTTRTFSWALERTNADLVVTLPSGSVFTRIENSLGDAISGAQSIASTFSNSTGSTFKAIDRDGNNTIDYVIATESATSKVANLDTTRLTLASTTPISSVSRVSGSTAPSYIGAKNLKETDAQIVNVAEGVAKDVWVNTTAKNAFTSNGKIEVIYNVAPTTVLTNSVLAKVEGGSGINSTKYYFEGTARTLGENTISLSSTTAFATTDVGNRYDIVFNANGYIVKRDAVQTLASSNWLYIKSVQNNTDGVNPITSAVNVLLADGTSKSISVSSDLKVGVGVKTKTVDAQPDLTTVGGNVNSGADMYTAFDFRGDAFNYSLNSSGEIVELCMLDYVNTNITGYKSGAVQSAAANAKAYDKDSHVFIGGGLTGHNTANTVVFFDGETAPGVAKKYSVFNGLELNTLTTADSFAVDKALRKDDGSYAVVVLKSPTVNTAPIRTADKIGLLVNTIKEVVDGKFIYTFKVAYDGKVEEVKSEPQSTSNSTWEGLNILQSGNTYGYYTLKFNNAGQVTDIDRTSAGTSAGNRATMVLDRVLDGALVGKNIAGVSYGYRGASESVKYQLTGAGADLSVALGENVNYYLVNSAPVSGTDTLASPITGHGGFISKTTAISVVDKSTLQESSLLSSGLSYVVDVVFNNDIPAKAVGVYFYAQPVLRLSTATTPTLTTASTISSGQVNPTVALTTSGTFKNPLATTDFTINAGATGLTVASVAYTSATTATVSFSGTAAAGVVTVQANLSAFIAGADANSATATVTVGAAGTRITTGQYTVNKTAPTTTGAIGMDPFGTHIVAGTARYDVATVENAAEIKALIAAAQDTDIIYIDNTGKISAFIDVATASTITMTAAGYAPTFRVIGITAATTTVTGVATGKTIELAGSGANAGSSAITVTATGASVVNITGATLTVTLPAVGTVNVNAAVATALNLTGATTTVNVNAAVATLDVQAAAGTVNVTDAISTKLDIGANVTTLNVSPATAKTVTLIDVTAGTVGTLNVKANATVTDITVASGATVTALDVSAATGVSAVTLVDTNTSITAGTKAITLKGTGTGIATFVSSGAITLSTAASKVVLPAGAGTFAAISDHAHYIDASALNAAVALTLKTGSNTLAGITVKAIRSASAAVNTGSAGTGKALTTSAVAIDGTMKWTILGATANGTYEVVAAKLDEIIIKTTNADAADVVIGTAT